MIDKIVADTGLSIKEWIVRMAKFFRSLDKSERGIVLASIHPDDAGTLAKMVLKRLGQYPQSHDADAVVSDAQVAAEADPSKPKRKRGRPPAKTA